MLTFTSSMPVTMTTSGRSAAVVADSVKSVMAALSTPRLSASPLLASTWMKRDS